MNAFKALALVSLLSTLAPLANAATIGGSIPASSCEIVSPFKLTEAETLMLQNHGYSLKAKRGSFHTERFLGVYNYFEMKHGHAATGEIYLRPVLVSRKAQQSQYFGQGDVEAIPRREFQLNVQMPYGPKSIAFYTSASPKGSTDEFQVENANFDGIPSCK